MKLLSIAFILAAVVAAAYAACLPLSTNSGVLCYDGGKVLYKKIHVYIIYYGDDWKTKHHGKEAIEYWFNNIDDTRWWKILQRLTDNKGNRAGEHGIVVKKTVANTGSELSQGKSLSRPTIYPIVLDNLQKGRLPYDPNGIYFVLTSPDVILTDNCSPGTDCGFHDHDLFKGKPVVYSWVGDFAGNSCNNGCVPSENALVSPNGDVGVDGCIDFIAHELSEAATNPYYDAWEGKPDAFDEIGDLCEFTNVRFGNLRTLRNGAKYNFVLGRKKYLIQKIFKVTNTTTGQGFCSLH